jgi:2-aminoadipate transaminase
VASVSTQHALRAGVIDLARGDPAPEALGLEIVRAAAQRVTDQRDPAPLQYGFEPGDDALRAALAELVAPALHRPDPARLFVAAGASAALDLICTRFAPPGSRVLVAERTYHLALALFADHHLRVEAVAGDDEGIDPDALERALAAGGASLVYLVPAFANPTTLTIPPERAQALIAVCRRYGVRIVADEVYRLTAFGAPPPSLASFGPDLVLALQSFSKVLAPGLRLGFVDASPEDAAALARSGLLRSGGGMNPFIGAVVREVLASGAFAEHLVAWRAALRERAALLTAALREHAPAARFAAVAGGFFLWVHLPGVDVADLPRRGVAVAPGPQFVAPPGDGAQAAAFARLSFAHAPRGDLRTAALRLGAAAV